MACRFQLRCVLRQPLTVNAGDMVSAPALGVDLHQGTEVPFKKSCNTAVSIVLASQKKRFRLILDGS